MAVAAWPLFRKVRIDLVNSRAAPTAAADWAPGEGARGDISLERGTGQASAALGRGGSAMISPLARARRSATARGAGDMTFVTRAAWFGPG